MKITICDEEKAVSLFLEKKEVLLQKALYMKNDNKTKKIRTNDKKAINNNDLENLYDKVIFSLKAIGTVLEDKERLASINLLSLLTDFAYIDLKFNDKQLTCLLLYVLRRNLDGNKLELTDRKFANFHNIVKLHYFDKQDTDGNLNNFTNKDVELINEALRELDIHKKIKPKIIKVLNEMAIVVEDKVEEDIAKEEKREKNKHKKEKKDYTNLQSLIKTLSPVEQAPMLSKKEYYRISNELLEYFSFDSSALSSEIVNNSIMLDKPLCSSERNRCVELLKQAKYEISTIKVFLEKAYSYNKYCMNPLAFYNDIYDLLRDLIENNYDEYYYLEVYIEDINKLILEMNMTFKKNYSSRLELIKNMLDEILEMLPQEKINSYYLDKAKVLKK